MGHGEASNRCREALLIINSLRLIYGQVFLLLISGVQWWTSLVSIYGTLAELSSILVPASVGVTGVGPNVKLIWPPGSGTGWDRTLQMILGS